MQNRCTGIIRAGIFSTQVSGPSTILTKTSADLSVDPVDPGSVFTGMLPGYPVITRDFPVPVGRQERSFQYYQVQPGSPVFQKL